MKKYLIEWETDYCDNFPERSGETIIEAANEDEAAQRFYETKLIKACILRVSEVN